MELSEVLKKIHNAETERLFAITDSFSPHELLGVLTESIESYKRLRDESLTAFNKIKAQLADMESACDKIRKSKEEMELDLGASLITYNHNKDEFPHSTALRRAFEEVSKESGSIINRQSAKISEMLSDCYIEYVYGSRDRPYRVYDRADEQWEKFVNCTEYYYATEYQAYFDGERTEEEINDIIRNKLLAEYMDDTGKTLFATGAERPVHFSTDGNVTLTIPPDHIVVHTREELENSKFVDKEHIQLKKRTYNSNLTIANGAEAERDIAVDISDGMYIERQFDWKKYTIKAAKDVTDIVLPGSGKVIGTADKIFTTIMDTAQKVDEYRKQEEFCEANKPFYQWFVGTFNIKCVTTENGYLLYPSKDTEALYQKMLVWLKENGYLKIYNMYCAPKEACFDGAEMMGAEWFVSNVDVTELYNVLDGTGKLDEFASAVC